MNTQMKIIHNYKEDDEDEVYLDDEDAGWLRLCLWRCRNGF
jgi:hypothetical protein